MTFPSAAASRTSAPKTDSERGPRLRLVGHAGRSSSDPDASSDVDEPRARRVQQLHDLHHQRLVVFLRRLTGIEQAEEVAQEVFFRLLQVRNLERREISVGYLFRIGENLVRKRYHRDQRHQRASEELRYRFGPGSGDHAGLRETVAGAAGSKEMAFLGSETLHQAMGLLTNNEQAAIRLIICRGLSYEQAARSLGVNVSTINNWKHRGVKKLRRIIDEAHIEQQARGRNADPA
ncbi:MAG: hypothetical protein CMJ34_03865 [Phycisphaerae bacterium]|nr:hypothetical protein [Phycisphaerae bacterium]